MALASVVTGLWIQMHTIMPSTTNTIVDPLAKRHKAQTMAELTSGSLCAKSRLASSLQKLHDAGYLTSELISKSGEEKGAILRHRTIREHLQISTAEHSKATTVYGPVLQHVDLEQSNGKTYSWPHLNPFALLAYLSVSIPHFALLLKNNLENVRTTIIIYADEVRPGNALRPAKGRLVLAIYWIFKDFPERLLSNTSAWLPLGFLRSSKVGLLKGGLGGMMRTVLRIFFSPNSVHNPQNFRTGCVCTCQGQRFVIRADFEGFLGDEKCLKEIYDTKGAIVDGEKPFVTLRVVLVLLVVVW